MRVDCPSCAANYDIPDHLLVKGRKARCARCGTHFMPLPPDDGGLAPPSTDTDPEPAEAEAAAVTATDDADPVTSGRLSVQSHVPRPPLALRAAWGASIVLLLLLGTGTVMWRDTVVRHWPAGALILGSVDQ